MSAGKPLRAGPWESDGEAADRYRRYQMGDVDWCAAMADPNGWVTWGTDNPVIPTKVGLGPMTQEDAERQADEALRALGVVLEDGGAK